MGICAEMGSFKGVTGHVGMSLLELLVSSKELYWIHEDESLGLEVQLGDPEDIRGPGLYQLPFEPSRGGWPCGSMRCWNSRHYVVADTIRLEP